MDKETLDVSLEFNYYTPENGLPSDKLIRYSTKKAKDIGEWNQVKVILNAAGPMNCIDYILPGLRDYRGDLYKSLLIYWILNGNDEEMKFIIRRMTGALRDQDELCINQLEEMLLYCTSQGDEEVTRAVVEKLYGVIVRPEPEVGLLEMTDKDIERYRRNRNQREAASKLLLDIGPIGLNYLKEFNSSHRGKRVEEIIEQIESSNGHK